MSSVAHALLADLPALGASLTSAFSDDPVTCWLFRDEAQRPARLARYNRFALEMGLAHGHCYAARGNRAAAIWAPPDVTLFDELWAPRMVAIMKELLGERAGSVLKQLARLMTDPTDHEPHFYLFMLGTHAEQQGQGLGSELLEPVLAACDARGLAARLESSNPRNLPFYQRHGFEVIQEVVFPDDGPLVHKMRRPPAAQRASSSSPSAAPGCARR